MCDAREQVAPTTDNDGELPIRGPAATAAVGAASLNPVVGADEYTEYLHHLQASDWDGQVVTIDQLKRVVEAAVTKERNEGTARTACLVREALEKAEGDAHQVRLAAVQTAAEAVANHWATIREDDKRAAQVAQTAAVNAAVEQTRDDEQKAHEAVRPSSPSNHTHERPQMHRA